MSRDEVLHTRRARKQTLAERFGVTELALFGSFARDRASDGSDVDFLVGFDGPATSKSYFGCSPTSKTCWAGAWTSLPTRHCARSSVPTWSGRP